MSNPRRSILRPFGIVAIVAAGLAVVAGIDGMLYARDPAGLGVVIALGAALGVFLGTIYATDSRSGFDVEARPVLRTGVSIILGISVGFLVGLSPAAIAMCGVVLGVLGWLGMSWARYVDF